MYSLEDCDNINNYADYSLIMDNDMSDYTIIESYMDEYKIKTTKETKVTTVTKDYLTNLYDEAPSKTITTQEHTSIEIWPSTIPISESIQLSPPPSKLSCSTILSLLLILFLFHSVCHFIIVNIYRL